MDYINRCKKTKEDPLPMDIVRGLMPWRSCHRIIENLIHRGSSYERRLGHNGPISPRDLEARIPDHDLEPPQPGTHTRITR